jgi:hypothetical protein
MSDNSNVTPIRPTPSAKRKPRRRELFALVAPTLQVHQDRVCEARAVVAMLRTELLAMRSAEVGELQKVIRATDAIERILQSVQSIGSFADLAQQADDERASAALQSW